ncbi:Zinc/iron permease [Pleurotus eryngii]|uniref:Zinc/iron permease n=1 Tax=Pleurotus eryngii TaxID=5323 RepID=A0A9P5ZZF3_PLEER|nr:Zinc/iron permease [Pleurotus eryngii]
MNNLYTTNHDDSTIDVLPNDMLAKRVGAMILILVVSLTAVSFPGVSRNVRFLRIPHVVFFIGKHFGTGVILATAFCHLLQDAYTSLQDPEVRKGTDVARWTGLIILGSLLTIFLVEYISTSYVDRLNANPSVPSSPTESPSRAASPSPPTPLPLPPLAAVIQDNDAVSERTPLLLATPATAPIPSIPTSPRSTSPSPPATARTGIPIARYRSSSLHEPSSPNPYLPLVHSTNPRYISILGDRDHHRCCCTHDEFCGSLRRERTARRGSQSSGRKKCGLVGAGEGEGERSEGTAKAKAKVKSKKRASIVGIFAPRQFAHHHRHDLDIERGSERRHSHGSAHANARSEDSGHAYHHHDLEFLDEEEGEGGTLGSDVEQPRPAVGRRRQVVGTLVLQLGIMIHSFVIGLTLSITPKADFTSLVTAIFFHQLFEGLSLGIRIASLPPPTTKSSRSLLAPALSALFAITTPFGILIGLLSLGGGQGVHLRLTQGLMSAISAGMLIYAACVEMLAADFVNDPHMHMGVGGVRRQAVALGSLLCGVLLMTLVD